MITRTSRGDGVGIEITHNLVRGIRLGSAEPGHVVAAAEVSIETRHDERSTLDALVRLRAELGDPREPTRVAVFPPGSTLTRVDITGLTGPELNARRSELATDRGVFSSVLVDDGPRRWMLAVHWDDAEIRRLEDLTERAGFVDVAIDPSPVALVRVLDPAITRIRRDASTDQSFGVLSSGAMVIASAALDAIGRTTPGLAASTDSISPGWFDHVSEPTELVAGVREFVDEMSSADALSLRLADGAYPAYPAHDLRAPQRQCVALGAAVGAAGLAGRLRPVDMVLPTIATSEIERPWAIERLSDLPSPTESATIGPGKRMLVKVLPRRR